MKKLMVMALLVTGNLFAGERVLINDSKEINAEVNQNTVICSAKGYGTEELKINIKDLDGWTVLDHTNLRFGERSGLPCMTAGLCKIRNHDGFNIDDVIQGNPRIEKIIVKRKLIERREKEVHEDGLTVCQRTLKEELNTVVGGVKFSHSRQVRVEALPENGCTF